MVLISVRFASKVIRPASVLVRLTSENTALLGPTGALIVMMVYYISAAAAAANFSDFHSVH